MSDQPKSPEATKAPEVPEVPETSTKAPEASTSSPAPPTATTAPVVAPAESSPPPVAQNDLIPANDEEEDDDVRDDGDSALGSDAASSTASVTASILEYRQFKGRTYHSDRHVADYTIPNDEQQLESMDLTHHYLSLTLDGALYLAPIGNDVQKVLDVGTGSGIWAIDFADQFPNAEVIGSDLSPNQPQWVPPNVRFEVDDATLEWTFKDNTFDFVHIRYLFGGIDDWPALFREAYRCTAPGGWIESVEADIIFRSDDETTDLEPIFKTWYRLYDEGGRKLNRPFLIFEDNTQQRGIESAGFVDQKVVEYKLPIGGWPKDPKLAEIGNYLKLTLENDLEGYTLFLWHNVLNWPKDDYQLFLMSVRGALRNRKVHSYYRVRFVYARKPE